MKIDPGMKRGFTFAVCCVMAGMFIAGILILIVEKIPKEKTKSDIFIERISKNYSCWTDVDGKNYLFLKDNKSGAVFEGRISKWKVRLLQDLPGAFATSSRNLEKIMDKCYEDLRNKRSDEVSVKQSNEYQAAIDIVMNQK